MLQLLRFALLIALLSLGFLSQRVHAQTDLYLKNTATYQSGRYLWTVYVAGPESSLNNVSYVEYTLHYSFAKPVQEVRERGGKCAFALSSNSWGEFEIKAKIVPKQGREFTLNYWLDLLKNKTAATACVTAKPQARRRRSR